MALVHVDQIYAPRVLSDQESDDLDDRGWSLSAPNAARKRRVYRVELVHKSRAARGLVRSPTASAPRVTATLATDHARGSRLLGTASADLLLIEKALRHRCERVDGINPQHEEPRERGGVDLRRALNRHIRNQFVAIAAVDSQMFDDPDVRDVTRGLIDRLSVLLDESEQVLAAPERLRSAARRRVLAEPMFSEDEAVAASHERLAIGDLHSRRADSTLLALPTDSGFVYPRFQFDHGGMLHEVVWRINQLLGAADDPWGVASWWFSEHVRLSGRPADLVSAASRPDEDDGSADDGTRGRGAELLAAAKALTNTVR